MERKICTAEEFARMVGEDPLALTQFFVDAEQSRLATLRSQLQMAGGRPATRMLPFEDKDGYEFGRVAASIPEDMFMHMMRSKSFGMADRLKDPRGMEEVVKMHPICAVKTVSGKCRVGYTGRGGRWAGAGRVNMSRANFNHG